MVSETGVVERYLSAFASSSTDDGWLVDLSKRDMERFAKVGFPTKRRGNEPWKYTSIAPIAKAELELAPSPDVVHQVVRRAVPSGPGWKWTGGATY